jgi:hypothetical protein
MTRTRNRADLAARLRQLATLVESGRHPVPVLGHAPTGSYGGLHVPAVVHDLLCGWRIRVRLDTDPPVGLCAGCGLTTPLDPPGDPTSSEENPR